MIKAGTAGTMDRGAKCSLGAAVALLVLLFLAAPAGLAYHSGAHGQKDGDSGDCSLCDLGSHFSVELPTSQDMAGSLEISVLSLGGSTLPTPHDIFDAGGRAPPATSA